MGENMLKTISIIIPNFNRANLIGETLDSIIAQTHTNWECIIVDDGSTDNSVEVIKNHVEKDSRFKLYTRPNTNPKGANACRNIGVTKAKGEYIIFFDSDDIMLKNHLEIKYKTITDGNYDFIIGRSKYFNNPYNKNPINYRELDSLPITADNFITKKINWLTLDPIIKSTLAKQLKFTEKNQSAEEYNYFVKLNLITNYAFAIKDILTLRRYHENSYQVNLDNHAKIAENQFNYFWDTFIETKTTKISKHSANYLISNAINVFLKNRNYLTLNKRTFYYEIIKFYGLLKGLNKIRILELRK